MKRIIGIFYFLTIVVFFNVFNNLDADESLRTKKYSTRSPKEAFVWQKKLRQNLFQLLKLDDLVSLKNQISFYAKVISSKKQKKYLQQEIEINTTPGRRIKILLTLPNKKKDTFPAVVCIHGHGGNRSSVYEKKSIYKGFASVLAERDYVTISTDVGQHEVFEENRILMGERLWDLMRCVDYLKSLPQVDKSKIGCTGLSLGGEMAMWLGAMDKRIAATVSAGFLTVMDQMEQNHCMCWKFDGLRELVDFADIYSMIAPRPLMCQNGLLEPETQFYVPLAKKTMKEIKVIYNDFNRSENVVLQVHASGHEIDLQSLLEFLIKYFR
ncbi:acetylxylan esterase [candidate division KSB1 bacterium]|nr:acetylxylan esterase [candidate division KSB1 bacterium]